METRACSYLQAFANLFPLSLVPNIPSSPLHLLLSCSLQLAASCIPFSSRFVESILSLPDSEDCYEFLAPSGHECRKRYLT
jgi:hypothetical protein